MTCVDIVLSLIILCDISWQKTMSDNRRRFALRENGEETSVFKRNVPRQTALKAARRLEPAESEEEALANTERILGNAGYRFVFLFNLKVGLRAVKGAAKRFIYLLGRCVPRW